MAKLPRNVEYSNWPYASNQLLCIWSHCWLPVWIRLMALCVLIVSNLVVLIQLLHYNGDQHQHIYHPTIQLGSYLSALRNNTNNALGCQWEYNMLAKCWSEKNCIVDVNSLHCILVTKRVQWGCSVNCLTVRDGDHCNIFFQLLQPPHPHITTP